MRQIFSLAQNMVMSNFRRLRSPFKLTLMLTYRCVLRCKICNIWQKPARQELSLAEYREFFSVSRKFNWINLSGGEIFLRKDLLAIIETILDRCRDLYLLDFPTSGFNSEMIVSSLKEIIRMRPKKLLVTVSIDGPQELHDVLRGRPGLWEEAVRTYRQLKSLRGLHFDVFFGITLSEYNSQALFAIYEALKTKVSGLTLKDLHLNVVHTSSHYYGNLNVTPLNPEAVAQIIKRFKQQKGWPLSPVLFLEYRYLNLVSKYLKTQRCPLPCLALSSSCFIDPYGTLYPCSIFDQPLGNIREFGYSLEKAWQTGHILEIRSLIAQGRCPGCWTPCEAYQTILGNMLPLQRRKMMQQGI